MTCPSLDLRRDAGKLNARSHGTATLRPLMKSAVPARSTSVKEIRIVSRIQQNNQLVDPNLPP
jgi:hypothetical protein